jgi:succinate dehydrogenase/fumarate reductase flavoprotein subunit
VPGNTGDGIFMALDVGAELVNMDQIQLLHLCNPQTGATYDITAASLEGIFVNKEGKRFVREDGRRDEISKAILEQTDGIMYLVFSADYTPDASAARTFGGQTLQYYLDNKLSGYVKGETLDDLAAELGMPADELKKTVDEYNACVAGDAKDSVGRVSFGAPLLQGPYYAYPRSPAVHHTMGGVRVDTQSHALDKDGNPIPGLYCAGEITGNLHGGNRLGGNAIVDFTVFGKNAGENAADGK